MQIKNYKVYFFILILIGISVLAFLMFKPFLTAILAAAILVVTFRRPYKFMLKVTGDRKSLSAFLTSILVFIIIIIPVIVVSGLLVNEASSVYQKALTEQDFYHRYIDSTVNFLENIPVVQLLDFDRILSQEQLASSLSNIGQNFLLFIQKTYQNVAKFVLWVFVFFFTLYYLFIEGRNIANKAMYVSPLKDEHENYLIERFVSMTRATLKGTIVVGIIQGTLGAITFAIVGIPSVAIWGVIMIILSIIPAIGPAIVMVPAGIILLFMGQIWQGIFVIIMGVGIISTIDNLLRPRLVGHDSQMHPLLVFFATLGGIIAFGLVGFVVGPIIMALFLALWEIYGKEFKRQLNTFNKK